MFLFFSASWCPYCAEYEKILDQFDYPVFKIDVDAQPQIADDFKITNLPTLIMFDTTEVKRKLGVLSLDKLNKLAGADGGDRP